ncbi:MAG: hypothetical protein QXT53_02760 [Ignisphaera sp.]
MQLLSQQNAGRPKKLLDRYGIRPSYIIIRGALEEETENMRHTYWFGGLRRFTMILFSGIGGGRD